jgi:hypothetical protein
VFPPPPPAIPRLLSYRPLPTNPLLRYLATFSAFRPLPAMTRSRRPTGKSTLAVCVCVRERAHARACKHESWLTWCRALKHHPDKGGDPELFKELTHAW